MKFSAQELLLPMSLRSFKCLIKKMPQARERAEIEGFEISVAKTSFKANTKALAENEGEGLAKLIYRLDNGEILAG
ncbi:hypothetical protein LOK49_LG14G01656 [Camellia lanceoleosa]|uniref:Uncharacterized protein n=1 Tax=Camellia lanceoleosa TaxID=1840588 RepID=A0ACC0FDS8_9ERIC|nr:hypothetical protein LOK49_LG14G01656 [Camellia lanceoleosa]